MSDTLEAPQRDRRFLWLFLAALLVIVGGFVMFLLLYDISPPEDADMKPAKITSVSTPNPLGDFIEELIKNPISPDSQGRSRSGPTSSSPPARPDYALNRHKAMEAFGALMNSDPKMWRWPTEFSGLEGDRSALELSLFIPFSSLLRVKAESESSTSPDQAVTTFLALAQFGHGLSDAGGAAIHDMIAATLHRTAVLALEKPLAEQASTAALLESVQQRLADIEPSPKAFAEMVRAEYQFSKRMTEASLRGESAPTLNDLNEKGYPEPLKSLLHKPNLTAATRLAHDRTLIKALETRSWKNALAAHQSAQSETDAILASPVRFWVNPNTTGLYANKVDFESLRGTLERATTFTAIHRQVMLQVALRRYELDQQALPDTLEALVPKYLAAVPLDPYTDLPMKWNAASRLIYSVGPNLRDEGGTFTVPASVGTADPGMPYWWSEAGTQWREARKRQASDISMGRPGSGQAP